MKSILVTGGAGYIGSVACEELLKNDFNVIVIDDLSTGNKNAIFPESVFYNTRLNNKKALKEIFTTHHISAVLHFAGAALVSESVQNPQKYFDINFIDGIILIETMLEHNVKNIIFSSTCATYGIPKETDIPISENTKQKPINPYGESKLLFEQSLKWHSQNKGLKYIALRYFNVCGATKLRGEYHNPETHLIPLLLRSLKYKNEKFKIFGTDYPTPDGTTIRDYIHVVDLINGHIDALNALIENRSVNQEYNIGYGHGYSVLEIMKETEILFKQKVDFEFCDRRPGDPPILVANPAKIKKELGWNPIHDNISKIIESTGWHI